MTSKYCSTCHKLKPFAEFHKHVSCKNGYRSICKPCRSKESSDLRKTKEGLLSAIYNTQLSSSRDRGHVPPNYDSKEFVLWAMASEKYHDLHKQWEDSGYKTELKPSADRLDDYKPYSFCNLQWVTWQKNKDSYRADRINGVNTKNCTDVYQFSLVGEFIRHYKSIALAGRDTGVHVSAISDCAKGRVVASGGRVLTAGGFIWSLNKDIKSSSTHHLRKTNTSGVSGVHWSKPKKKWESCITVNGKSKHLGVFTEKHDAIEARISAEKEYYPPHQRTSKVTKND